MKKKHKLTRPARRRPLRVLVIPGAIGASLVGGFALAAFTMTGSVEADGTVATPTSPTAVAHIATLWPGECADVSVTFTNDNDQPVVIDSIDGRITRQPSAGNLGKGKDHGVGNDPVVWHAAPTALQDREIPAGGAASFTIPDAVCLSGKVGNEVAGSDVTASVDFGFHVEVGTEYEG